MESRAQNKLLRILWVSSVGEKGGAEVYMLNLLRNLDRVRFAPAVALLRPGPLEHELKAINIPTITFPAHRMRNACAVGRTILALKQTIRQGQIDFIHSNGFRAQVYGGVAAWLAKIPAVWTVHTVEKSSIATSAILRIPTAHVIANCPRTADFFLAHGHLTSLIWPSVDREHLQCATPRQELSARYQAPFDTRWIAMGARLQRYKGHRFFLRALAGLPSRMRSVHGIIMGGALFGMEQDYLLELENEASELGISERVHFTGYIPDADVYGFIQGSELLVHPALDEDFGLSVAEAQALGVPVLAFNSVGPAAIIAPEETGRLVPVGDQEGLNAALQDLLERPELLSAWGRSARDRAQRFEVSRAVSQLERIYEGLDFRRVRLSKQRSATAVGAPVE